MHCSRPWALYFCLIPSVTCAAPSLSRRSPPVVRPPTPETEPTLQAALTDAGGHLNVALDILHDRRAAQPRPRESVGAWALRVADHPPYTLMRFHPALAALHRVASAKDGQALARPPTEDEVQVARLYVHARERLIDGQLPDRPRGLGVSTRERLGYKREVREHARRKAQWMEGKFEALAYMTKAVSRLSSKRDQWQGCGQWTLGDSRTDRLGLAS